MNRECHELQGSFNPVKSHLLLPSDRLAALSAAGTLDFRKASPKPGDAERAGAHRESQNAQAEPYGDRESPLRICSWCKARFDEVQRLWVPLDVSPCRLSRLPDAHLPSISHGCCPDCYHLIRGKMYEYSRGG